MYVYDFLFLIISQPTNVSRFRSHYFTIIIIISYTIESRKPLQNLYLHIIAFAPFQLQPREPTSHKSIYFCMYVHVYMYVCALPTTINLLPTKMKRQSCKTLNNALWTQQECYFNEILCKLLVVAYELFKRLALQFADSFVSDSLHNIYMYMYVCMKYANSNSTYYKIFI